MIERNRQKIVKIILANKNEDWEKIVKTAIECHGDPKKFWQKMNILRGQKKKKKKKTLTANL